MVHAIRARWHRPVIVDPFVGQTAGDAASTCLLVCSRGFNQQGRGADVTIREGYARGFRSIGVGAKLIDGLQLKREIELTASPFVMLSIYDYQYLPRRLLRFLSGVPHFVWVNPWSREYTALWERYPVLDLPPDWLCRRVVESGPAFVWAPVGSRARSLFANWENRGLGFESIHLACDTSLYFPDDSGAAQFSDVRLAFVGTYNPVKLSAFEQLLRPYESDLVVYGRTPWPYRGYAGPLDRELERVLYGAATICPTVNAVACYDGYDEVNERVYKVLGSGGLTVGDPVSAFRELFAGDELLVADSVAEYHEHIAWLMNDESAAAAFRAAGMRSVLAKHTYAHRAAQVCSLLGVNHSIDAGRLRTTIRAPSTFPAK